MHGTALGWHDATKHTYSSAWRHLGQLKAHYDALILPQNGHVRAQQPLCRTLS